MDNEEERTGEEKKSGGIFALFKSFVLNRNVRLALFGVVLFAGLTFGILSFISYKKATLPSTVERINRAVSERNLDNFLQEADVTSLCQSFARAVLAVANDSSSGRPKIDIDEKVFSRAEALIRSEEKSGTAGKAGSKKIEDIQSALRQRLSGIFAAKEEKEEKEETPGRLPLGYAAHNISNNPLDDSVFDIVRKITPVIPQDIMSQIKEKPFVLKGSDDNLAVIETFVHHKELEANFPLRLGLARGDDKKWRITGLANPEDLASVFVNRIGELEKRARQAFDEENARIDSLMKAFYHIDQCQAILFAPGTSGVIRLRVVLRGKNLGDSEVLSSASLCEIIDEKREVLGKLRLENIRSVSAGESFEHAWFYSFENLFPEVEAMVGAQDIACLAKPQVVSLGHGQILRERNYASLPGIRLE